MPPRMIVLPSGTVTTVPTLLLVWFGGFSSEMLVKSERVRLTSSRSRSPSLMCGVISSVMPAS